MQHCDWSSDVCSSDLYVAVSPHDETINSLTHTHTHTQESFIFIISYHHHHHYDIIIAHSGGPHTVPNFHPIKNPPRNQSCLSVTEAKASMCFSVFPGTQLIKCNHVALHSTVRRVQNLSRPKSRLLLDPRKKKKKKL